MRKGNNSKIIYSATKKAIFGLICFGLTILAIRKLPDYLTLINAILITVLLVRDVRLYIPKAFFIRLLPLLRGLLVLIIVHIILFPVIYFSLIKLDPQSIAINNNVANYEFKNATVEAQNKYQPEKQLYYSKILNAVIKTNNVNLHRSITFSDTNLIKIDSVVLKSEIIEGQGEIPNNYRKLSIYDQKGLEMLSFNGSDNEVPLLDFLKTYLDEVNNKINSFYKTSKQIKNYEIWNYDNILPYSLNIFNTDNVRPLNKLTNVIVAVHQLIFVLIIGYLSSEINALFKKEIP